MLQTYQVMVMSGYGGLELSPGVRLSVDFNEELLNQYLVPLLLLLAVHCGGLPDEDILVPLEQ